MKMTQHTARLSLLALLTLTICAQLATLAQTPAQQPSALPPAHYVPSHDYDQRDIKLNLRFDWQQEQAIGTETITLAPLVRDLRRVELDAANMTFNSVTLAPGTPLKFETDASAEKLRIDLDRAYQPTDVLTFVIDYHTNGVNTTRGIASFGRGLTFIKPRADDPTRPRQIWSQGETDYNHYWFACFDQPNDFVTTEIVATVERPLMVVSNGRLLSVKDNKDNTRTFDWKIDEPHATYLTSIVVGDYTAVEGRYADIPVTSYVYPQEVAEGRLTTSRLPEMVKFFSEMTGVKYPYAKYAQTVARDFGGGMENISATTQTDNMIHDARAELDQTSDSLESHELAHQWFGDLVTCRSWSDIWLNESFATYFQALWDERSLGRDDFLYRDVKNNQDQYYAAWARGLRRPIVTKNYTNADAIFDTYAYPRGGAVLHMLHVALGDAQWWRAINHYLTKYAHQPVETEQFRIAVEEATGQSMDWFFDEWVYRMGHPVFRVTQAYDPAAKTLTLTVRQEQKIDPANAYPQVALFRTPVEVEIGTAQGTRVERALIEPKEEQALTFHTDAEPVLVNFDYGDTLIKELKFDKPTDALVYQLTRDTDMMGRMWALGQLSERMKAQATTDAERQHIAEVLSGALTGDKFWGMRVEAAAALQGVPGDTARRALLAATKDENARVRAHAVTSLAATKDQTLADVYLPMLGDQSYAVVRAAAQALGATKSPVAYDALVKLLAQPSWRDSVRISALMGLTALADHRALELALQYAAAGNPTAVRASAVTLLVVVGKDDPRTFPLVADVLMKAVTPFNFALAGAAGRALVDLGDPRGLEVIEQARKASSDQRAGALLQRLEQQLRQQGQPTQPNPTRP
jgi:aminopeptidase N